MKIIEKLIKEIEKLKIDSFKTSGQIKMPKGYDPDSLADIIYCANHTIVDTHNKAIEKVLKILELRKKENQIPEAHNELTRLAEFIIENFQEEIEGKACETTVDIAIGLLKKYKLMRTIYNLINRHMKETRE